MLTESVYRIHFVIVVITKEIELVFFLSPSHRNNFLANSTDCHREQNKRPGEWEWRYFTDEKKDQHNDLNSTFTVVSFQPVWSTTKAGRSTEIVHLSGSNRGRTLWPFVSGAFWAGGGWILQAPFRNHLTKQWDPAVGLSTTTCKAEIAAT